MTNAPTAIPGNIPALVSLLERQRGLYQQLRALSQQQAELVASAMAEPLLGVLAQRQKLIDSLTTINTQLDPYRQRWAQLWSELADADRQQIGGLVKEVQELLGSIIQQDDRDRAALQTAKGKVAAELDKISRAGQAVNAYRAKPGAASTGIASGDNRFTNQKG